METIIVASDFSDEAKNATEYAIKMAKTIDASVVLFNLHILSVHAVNSRLPYEAILATIEKSKLKIENQVDMLSKKHDVEITSYFAMGDFYEQLQHAIETYKANLVIMGMHEKTLEGDLLGSTTTESIHKLKTPILAIPLNAKFIGINKILYACDLNKGVTSKILEKVKLTTQKFNAELKVFHVNDTMQETTHIAEILEPLEGVSYYYKSMQSDSVIAEIKKELINFKPDILIMVPYEYGFWSSLIHKSKTRIMASGLDMPLLSIHA